MCDKMEIYGFSGKLGTGKNYVAEQLFRSMLPPKRTVVMALADHFKVDCCSKEDLTYHRVFVEKDDESRSILQRKGTEDGRAKYGDDIWIRILETWMRVHRERGVERVIITDLRYPNEVEWAQSIGGKTFRITAPQRNTDKLNQEAGHDPEKLSAIQNHISETSLDDFTNFDYTINNDYVDQPNVANRIRDIVRELTYQAPKPLTIFCDMDDTICECHRFYRAIMNQTKERIVQRTGIARHPLQKLFEEYVESFEQRYFTRDDFARSLSRVALKAFVVQDMALDVDQEFIKEIYELGLSVYDHNYDPLFEDSLKRLREMQQIGQLVIFTLGDYTEQMKKVAHLGLQQMHIPIEIFTHKDENMFRYLQNKYPADQYVMIGDSFQRDIMSAHGAGIRNLVHISEKPHKYQPANCDLLQVDRINDDLIDYLKLIASQPSH